MINTNIVDFFSIKINLTLLRNPATNLVISNRTDAVNCR